MAVSDRERAILAIQRGVPLGEVLKCSCRTNPPTRNGCFGVCEDAVAAIVASYEDLRREVTAALSDQAVVPRDLDQIERLLPVKVEVTGPYHYDGDKHPCLRITTADRIVACVYIVDDNESRAFSEAQMIKEAFRLGGKEIDRLHYLSGALTAPSPAT